MVDEAVLNAAPENELIRNTMKKADLLLNSYKNPVCSISGGSDSDVMLDLLERVRGNRKITSFLIPELSIAQRFGIWTIWKPSTELRLCGARRKSRCR